LASLVLGALLSGCASTSSTSAGYSVFYTNTVDPITATPAVGASKKGISCVHNVLGLAAFGDASIEEAKKQGDIKVVSSVDRDAFRIFIFYGKSCTIVKGE
jgi:hypothetical protein